MSGETPFPYDPAQVIVQQHAVHRARERSDHFRGRDDDSARREIARLLVESLGKKGQVFENRPRDFRVPGEPRARTFLPPWQRLVRNGRHGFIVDVSEAPKLSVVTVFTQIGGRP